MWNTLYVPLETGWQCTLIPGPQYFDLTCFGRGYRDLPARWLYPNAGRDRDASMWSEHLLSEEVKSERWEKDRRRQLTQDRMAFARHFRPNWDLHTITGEKALREVQAFVRDRLKLAHWNLPTDVAGVRKLLCDAVASGRLVPVINREYRGQPHVAQPDPAPQRWPAMGGGGSAHRPKVISYDEFLALQRANGELPPLDAPAGGVGVTLDPLPNHGAPATADDGFGLLSFVESAAGASLGSGDDDSDSDDGDAGGVSDDDPFSVDSGDGSTPLGDAQPFDYQPDIPDGDVDALAASTNKENYAARMLGYDRKTFGDMIHAMKSYNNLRGDDNVIWHDDGDVEFNGEIIDNMHNWGR